MGWLVLCDVRGCTSTGEAPNRRFGLTVPTGWSLVTRDEPAPAESGEVFVTKTPVGTVTGRAVRPGRMERVSYFACPKHKMPDMRPGAGDRDGIVAGPDESLELG